jgi:hypothetical protein
LALLIHWRARSRMTGSGFRSEGILASISWDVAQNRHGPQAWIFELGLLGNDLVEGHSEHLALPIFVCHDEPLLDLPKEALVL